MDESSTRASRIAIIGAGPAGTTLATLLAKKGASVVVFDDGKRPGLVVGESLVPLLVQVFRDLGIEERVKALGIHKPGVTFTIDADFQFDLSFQAVNGLLPTYAYNVPRAEFDQLIADVAAEAKVKIIRMTAQMKREEDRLLLAAETLALVPEWHDQQPDLVVDASGRRRLIAKLMGVEADLGPRKDVAHFAHYADCQRPHPEGTVIIGRLAHGWSWRIPLTDGRLSIGVVINKEHAKSYGTTPEEVLEAVIDRDPRLGRECAERRRLTPIATYTNYQLISHRGHGQNWVMVGDAFGFVDPMLSPGLCMAMVSARKLAKVLPTSAKEMAHLISGLARYEQWFRHQLSAWHELVDYFYNGKIFAIYQSGKMFSERYPGRISDAIERHVSKNIAGMAAGALTGNAYPTGLLRFMSRYAIRGVSPEEFVIR